MKIDMKKLLIISLIALTPFLVRGQTAATFVAAGDTVSVLTDSTWIFVDKVGATDSTHVIRLKPLFDAKVSTADATDITPTIDSLKASIDSIDMIVDSLAVHRTAIDDAVDSLAVHRTELDNAVDSIAVHRTELDNATDSIAAHRTDIDLKAPIAAPTFTTSITIGDAGISEAELEILDGATLSTAELNVLDGIPAGLTYTEIGYVDGVTSAIQTQIDAKQDTTDAINAYTLFPALADTIPFFGIAIGGEATDTVLFSYHDYLYRYKHSGTDTLHITLVTGIGQGTTDLDINLYKDVNMFDATPTQMLTSDLTITSTTTGDEGTVFDDAVLAPGDCFWIRVNECTTQPTGLMVGVYGYLAN
jgi:hypothetical protein